MRSLLVLSRFFDFIISKVGQLVIWLTLLMALVSAGNAIYRKVYYLHLCLTRYNGDVATAAAAYHSGWGTVDNLLQMEEHSADGVTLQGFPYNQMNHYVKKITSCYAAYQRIYAGN